MKADKLVLLAAVAGASLLAQVSSAQEGLIEIYELALTNDPSLREAEANYLATAEAKQQARALLLPSLQLSSSLSAQTAENQNPPLDFQTGLPSPIISSTETDRDAQSMDLTLNQTIFNWGAT
jgi:outer membrane protein